MAKSIDNSLFRYQDLKLKEALTKPYKFSLACKELSFILRNGYSIFPKNLQSIVFQETLFALSLLPQVKMQSAISAANSLLQSAEAAFPKQKKMLAVKEYKHAVVASKRKSKADQEDDEGEEGLSCLPNDVLVHIFSLLDFQSLVSASAICRSWNAAATDNHLWKNVYDAFFCKSGYDSKFAELNTSRMIKYRETIYSPEGSVPQVEIEWRFAFKTAYTEMCSGTYYSHRGYCSSCSSVVWVTNACSSSPCLNHQIKPISLRQIVGYILDGFSTTDKSWDYSSDSDDDNDVIFSMWAYPTL